jgi:hypothetical protein
MNSSTRAYTLPFEFPLGKDTLCDPPELPPFSF